MVPLVELSGISKRFGTVQALEDVSMTVVPGTIHALVGENGAGKTSLMRILYGAFPADEGVIRLSGEKVKIPTSAAALSLGIGMVSQHYVILPELTCLENLVLGAEPKPWLDRASLEAKAEELAQRMGFRFDWKALANGIGPAQSQKLEILKLLWRNSNLMILDEPTAMLSPEDSDALFASLKALVKTGTTVIVVTHRLTEVLQHCQTVTVLRGGKHVADRQVSETTLPELASMVVGHSLNDVPARVEPSGEALLVAENLTVLDTQGHRALNSVSFSVRAGEILGIAGVDGNGQRELVAALAGQIRSPQGALRLQGRSIGHLGVKERSALGIRHIPEDRNIDGLVEEWSLEENSALGLHHLKPFRRGSLIDGLGRFNAARAIAERFSTRYDRLSEPVSGLSGGNQQRFVNGRALFSGPQLIVAFQPVRGLDIGATRAFYEALSKESRHGTASVVVSFDLDELLEFCDRILVLNAGHLREPTHKTRSEIGMLMVSA